MTLEVKVPRRQHKGPAPSKPAAISRLSAFLLLVVTGVLGTAQAASASTTQQDVSYLNASHQINLTIIQAAEAAKAHGKSSCVRRVGALMERDHRRLAAQELKAARQLGVGLVPIPSLAQRQKLDALAAKVNSPEYDAAWLTLQREEHRRLLTLIAGELAKGREPAVKSVAKGAQPVIQMHLRMVQGPCRVITESPKVPTGDGGQMADAQRTRSLTALVLIGLGMLLLAGKATRVRRRLLGLSALVIGIALVFARPPGDAGKVPEGGLSAAEREAAIPPVRLSLAGFVNAPVVPVAAGGDGQLQVPQSPSNVGWWAAGAAPGSASGTVLLAGHVDSARQGRGVFAALWNVPVGAKVAVTAGDGSVHRYHIVARRIYPQEQLPPDLFHGASKPRLVLVTCTGTYNHSQHRYTHNLVLYAIPLPQS
jgi:predicted outer membrane protein